jgi:hypothetical protein
METKRWRSAAGEPDLLRFAEVIQWGRAEAGAGTVPVLEGHEFLFSIKEDFVAVRASHNLHGAQRALTAGMEEKVLPSRKVSGQFRQSERSIQ